MKSRKLIGLILSMAIVAGSVPSFVFADEQTDVTEPSVATEEVIEEEPSAETEEEVETADTDIETTETSESAVEAEEITEDVSIPAYNAGEDSDPEVIPSVSYIDHNGNTKTATNVKKMPAADDGWVYLPSGWYIVDENISYGHIFENGSLESVIIKADGSDVNIILADNCSMDVTGSIFVPQSRYLHIWAQSNGDNMGKLSVVSKAGDHAAIGGLSNGYTDETSCGSIEINGGNIDATSYGGGAAIGGGNSHAYGSIRIKGGNVVATSYGNKVAAIGCGNGIYDTNGGYIAITGGTVEAKASDGARALAIGDVDYSYDSDNVVYTASSLDLYTERNGELVMEKYDGEFRISTSSSHVKFVPYEGCDYEFGSMSFGSDEETYLGIIKYNGNDLNVVLPDKIPDNYRNAALAGQDYQVVGKNAFNGNRKLRTITMNSNIIGIGANAFEGCTNLSEIYIYSDFEFTSYRCFAKCPNLVKFYTTSTYDGPFTLYGSATFDGSNNVTLYCNHDTAFASLFYDDVKEVVYLSDYHHTYDLFFQYDYNEELHTDSVTCIFSCEYCSHREEVPATITDIRYEPSNATCGTEDVQVYADAYAYFDADGDGIPEKYTSSDVDAEIETDRITLGHNLVYHAINDVEGYYHCTRCGQNFEFDDAKTPYVGDETPATVKGYSVYFDGTIGMKIYMTLDTSLIYLEEDAALTLSQEGKEPVVYPLNNYRNTQKIGNTTYYVFDIKMAAKEMNDKIKVTLFDGTSSIELKDVSVMDYITYVSDYMPGYEYLSEYISYYGQMSQYYFNHKTDECANRETVMGAIDNEYDRIPADKLPTDYTDYTIHNLPSGVRFYGSSLVLKDRLKLKLYFTGDEFTVKSNISPEVATVTRDGEYNVVTISNISIRNLKDDIRIIFNNNNNSYMVVNPLVYCNKTLALTETDAKTMERKAIIKAMICICVEANKFPTA